MNLTKTLLILTLSLAAVACGDEPRGPSASTAAQEKVQTTPPTTSEDKSEAPDSCLSENCSYEVSQCDANCQALLECINGCDEATSDQGARDGCMNGCITAFGETATRQLGSVFSCYEQACL